MSDEPEIIRRKTKQDRVRQAVAKLLDSVDRAIAAADDARKARDEFERIVTNRRSRS